MNAVMITDVARALGAAHEKADTLDRVNGFALSAALPGDPPGVIVDYANDLLDRAAAPLTLFGKLAEMIEARIDAYAATLREAGFEVKDHERFDGARVLLVTGKTL